MKDHRFQANGEEYEIMIGQSVQNHIIVQAFNTKTNEAVGFSYGIDFSTNVDMEKILGVSGVQTLINLAKDDVINKRKEELMALMKNVPREMVTSSEIRWR